MWNLTRFVTKILSISMFSIILKHWRCTKNEAFHEVFFCICDQIRSFLLVWSHLLKKSLMENFICGVWWNFFVITVNYFQLLTISTKSFIAATKYWIIKQWRKITVQKQEQITIPKFHLISWCGNFVERPISAMWLSTKLPHQKIWWNSGLLSSE